MNVVDTNHSYSSSIDGVMDDLPVKPRGKPDETVSGHVMCSPGHWQPVLVIEVDVKLLGEEVSASRELSKKRVSGLMKTL